MRNYDGRTRKFLGSICRDKRHCQMVCRAGSLVLAQLRRIFNSCRYTLPGTFYRCDAQQIKTHVPMEIYWAPQGWAIFGDTLTKPQFLQLEFLIRLSTKSVFTMKDRQGIAINSSGNRWGEVPRLITSYRHWQLRYCFNLEYFQRKNWHLGQ